MSPPLPRLRSDLDVMPSPLPGEPGILLRDPFRYTDAVVIVPPPWIVALRCLDGAHSELDAQVVLTRSAGGTIVPRDTIREFVAALEQGGFLETEGFLALKKEKQDAFRAAAFREASHAGSAYPEEEDELMSHFEARMPEDPGREEASSPFAIAAPHVSPEGGFASYRSAYDASFDDDPTFVILGTSHHGIPERFGLTRKTFRTPLGSVPVDRESVDFLARRAPDAVVEEDYCHSHEHSIELQVLFLQYRLRRPFRIVPILCGAFFESLKSGKPPEAVESNRVFFDALGELAETRPFLRWVLGVDMAHVGVRYGDGRAVRAGAGRMVEVSENDRERLERICAFDAEGFFELVHPGGDELNWCGYSPYYTFLKSLGPVLSLRGRVRHYEQWNIDPQSVVSFAAVHFERTD